MINSINSFNYVTNTTSLDEVSNLSAQAASREVEFSYNPQDELVMDPLTVKLPVVSKEGEQPETNNVRFGHDRRYPTQPLKANENGGYVFDDKTDTKNFVSANSMATIQKTFDDMKAVFGEDMSFAFGREKIDLFADHGKMLNAYYTRDGGGSLNFFHDTDPVTGQIAYSGASGEVISHEVGHAILDGQRPNFMMTWKADTNGLHEAFGDITALYMSTQSDEVCQLAAQQCGGDLHKDNCIANTGESLGTTINHQVGRNATGGDYVRTFLHDLKWEDPNGVPERPNKEHPVGTEMHDWSKIFSGAHYDVMADLTKRNMEEGMDAASAIKAAGKESMEILAGAIKASPESDASYRDIAMCMLKYDEQHNGGKAHDIILRNMQNRNILQEGDDTPSDLSMASISEFRDVTITLDGPEFGKFSGASVSGKTNGGFNAMSGSAEATLAQDMKRLIKNGSILYTEPNQKVTREDMFDSKGNAYLGIVRWVDGQMTIEHTGIIS
ncbi:hypothetical protein IJT10_04465 [bacterium]|nr:hypothetical protein [bacterium]